MELRFQGEVELGFRLDCLMDSAEIHFHAQLCFLFSDLRRARHIDPYWNCCVTEIAEIDFAAPSSGSQDGEEKVGMYRLSRREKKSYHPSFVSRRPLEPSDLCPCVGSIWLVELRDRTWVAGKS